LQSGKPRSTASVETLGQRDSPALNLRGAARRTRQELPVSVRHVPGWGGKRPLAAASGKPAQGTTPAAVTRPRLDASAGIE
jgi:hypothetical protein